MSNTLMPIAMEQIMRDHLERAEGYRRMSELQVSNSNPLPGFPFALEMTPYTLIDSPFNP